MNFDNVRVFEVGGTIRDEILGIPNKDKDYAIECNSYEQMREFFLASGGRIYQERPEFGTIRGKLESVGDADFTICRVDGFYSDGRRPDRIRPGTILEDLARRDFTMNAIARNIYTGEILDPYNGERDIAIRTIRCVGDIQNRMNEDALRMVRALRFGVTKKMAFSGDIIGFLFQQSNYHLLENISSERIYEELMKMFKFSTPATLRMIKRFPELFDFIFATTPIWMKPTMEMK